MAYNRIIPNTSYNKEESGGFLNTSESFVSSSFSPTKTDEQSNRRIQNVVPCTVAQVLNVPENTEQIRIGSLSAHIVTLVGMVCSVDLQSMKITYLLDDLTASPLEVQMWLGENEDATHLNFALNSYIRFTGAIRTVKGKRLLMAFKAKPVVDMNELTMHILEVIHTAMSVEDMDNQRARAEVVDINFSNSAMLSDFSVVMSGLNSSQKMVYEAILACKDEHGLNCKLLYTALPLNRRDIDEILEFLNNEGHIYSTIDDNHYKATD